MAQPSLRVKLITLLVAPVLFFGLLEVVLRAAGFRFDPLEVHAGGEFLDEVVETRIFAPDPVLLWTLHPSTRIDVPEGGMMDVQTNSLGLRGTEPTGRKAPGELRVFCLGDSVTFGLGLPDNCSWPDRLGEALRRDPALAGRSVQVLNGAVPGWSSVQGMRLLDRVRDLEPDVVVFWFGLNDAKRARGAPDSAASASGGSAEDFVRRLRALRVFQLVQAGIVKTFRAMTDQRRVSVSEYRAAVDRLRDEAASGGPLPIFIRYPERLSKTIEELSTIVDQAEEAGVESIAGPVNLLLPATPADPGTDLSGRTISTEDGPTIIFHESRANGKTTLEAVRRGLGLLRDMKSRFDVLIAELPEESLDREDLFGGIPESVLYRDNCHLSERGAIVVAEAVASKILKALKH